MNMNYYGQFGTDRIIEEYFPNKLNGNCIEVGAVDGEFGSNTLHFEELGWKALCIEPVPSNFDKLKSKRKLSLNFAITTENIDNLEFTEVTLSDNNKSAISGLKIDEKLFKLHQDYGLSPTKQVINISGRRLDWCIENFFNYETIDFISIDTEGTELDVLKSFDVNKYNTKLLVIENNWNDPEIEQYLNERGWRKDKRIEINDFYIR